MYIHITDCCEQASLKRSYMTEVSRSCAGVLTGGDVEVYVLVLEVAS